MAKGYSKQVTDRQKSSRSLAETISTNQEAIASGLEAVLERVAVGKKVPDTRGLLALLAQLVTTNSEETAAADRAHELEMADDVAPRNARDSSAAKVRETLIDLRGALLTTYGDATVAAFGLAAAVPTDGQAVVSFGQKVSEALATVKLGKPKRDGVSMDLKVFAKELKTHLPALEGALSDVTREVREGQATLGIKTKAIETNDRDFQRVGALVEQLAKFANLPEVAKKARPSARKPGQAEADDEPTDGVRTA